MDANPEDKLKKEEQMVRKIFAVLLFLYALWQVITCLNAPTQGQGIAQIIWAILAICGGVYLWKQSNKSKENKT